MKRMTLFAGVILALGILKPIGIGTPVALLGAVCWANASPGRLNAPVTACFAMTRSSRRNSFLSSSTFVADHS